MILAPTLHIAVFLLIVNYANCQAHRQDKKWVDKSISCYECNSEFDPRCADPFNNYTIGIVNCSLKQPPEHIDSPPSVCRKVVQTVNGKTRVIRSCGYIVSDRDDQECARKTGTHEVLLRYCSCTKSLCNDVDGVHFSMWMLIYSAIALSVTK